MESELDFDYWVAATSSSSTENNNAGLIAGLVVGLGGFLILLAVIIHYTYKKFIKNPNEVISYKPTEIESKSIIEISTNNVYGGD